MPLILGHRGMPVSAPENTIPSFRQAMRAGADGIELDVHLSKDGQLVVIHDEKVDRTTDGSGLVRDKTLAELLGLNAAAKFGRDCAPHRIPTLAEVVDEVGAECTLLNIEIKSGIVLYPGIEQELVAFVRKRALEGKVIFSSFNHYSLMQLKQIAPDLRVGLLYMEALVEPWRYARRIGADALHPAHYTVFPEFVAGAHATGIAVNAWTVDKPDDLVRMIRSGVDAVITNDTATALEVREREEKA
ncbi:MAG: glycerophosphodiester phosphodiesterase [Clostridia bacterium]|nr:glycerophosphodiester phosphodiesterase [Clostridia bacterium]